MTMRIDVVTEATDDVVAGLNHLLPQLSSSAPALTGDDVARMVAQPDVTLLVARSVEGAIVGSLTLAMFAIPTGLRAWIEDVVVDESARGAGVGRELTTAAIGIARQHGARSIDLTSRPTREAANGLYRSMGFERRETNVYRFSLES